MLVFSEQANSASIPVTEKKQPQKQNTQNTSVKNPYLWQVQEKMSGGADDWSLPADFTLGFLEGTAINDQQV